MHVQQRKGSASTKSGAKGSGCVTSAPTVAAPLLGVVWVFSQAVGVILLKKDRMSEIEGGQAANGAFVRVVAGSKPRPP